MASKQPTTFALSADKQALIFEVMRQRNAEPPAYVSAHYSDFEESEIHQATRRAAVRDR